MEPDYYDLIMQWYRRALDEEEIFTKFIFLYIAFNAFMTQTRAEMRERQKIEFLKGDQDAKEFYLNLLHNDHQLKETMKELLVELDRESITNSTDGGIYWIGENGKLNSEEDWENLVEFWYRVRNNLFHGHKVPDFPRDKRLVTYAYLTLFPLMQNFVKHYLTWDFS